MQSAINFRWWFVVVLFCCSATLIFVVVVVEGVDWVPICLLVSTLSSTRDKVERDYHRSLFVVPWRSL
jgi:hypothetical protein